MILEAGVATVELVVPVDAVLHARPAAAFVHAAAQFSCVLMLENLSNGHGPVNARSVISLLGLGASSGMRLRLIARGDGAQDAVDALACIFVQLFGDIGAP
ncbi:MAG: HPr family phosphocarrier protein [Chloroflexi bacterium]|nr:HPr family phosphocarrier protein [Chloroflexota bacterium]